MSARHDLSMPQKRRKLPPRSSYYASRVKPGVALCYRRRANEKIGNWAVRRIDPGSSGYSFRSLGRADDDGDGTGLSFTEALARVIAEDQRQTPSDDPPLSYALERWRERYRLSGRATSKGTQVLFSVTGLIEDALGDLRMSELTPFVVTNWRDSLLSRRKPLKVSTANKYLATLKSACSHTADLIDYDGPRGWTKVKKLPLHRDEGRRLFLMSDAQFKSLLAASDPHLRRLILFLDATGARIGESVSLKWPDVDLIDGRARVSGKTGPRWITVNSSTLEMLQEMEAQAADATGHVFRQADGRDFRHDRHIDHFRRAMARAGMPPGVTAYSLRHRAISRAMKRQVPLALAARHFGTNVSHLTETYFHSDRDSEKRWFG